MVKFANQLTVDDLKLIIYFLRLATRGKKIHTRKVLKKTHFLLYWFFFDLFGFIFLNTAKLNISRNISPASMQISSRIGILRTEPKNSTGAPFPSSRSYKLSKKGGIKRMKIVDKPRPKRRK